MHKPFKIPESVLVVIHTAELDVLLIERTGNPGFWQSVTGSLDAVDEPFMTTATRELFEETGIVANARETGIVANARETGIVANARETGIVADGERIVLRDWHLANVYEIYPVWRHRYAPGVTHNTEHVFSVEVPRDIPILLAPREHTAHVWLPYLAAADKCFSSSNAEAILQLPRVLGR